MGHPSKHGITQPPHGTGILTPISLRGLEFLLEERPEARGWKRKRLVEKAPAPSSRACLEYFREVFGSCHTSPVTESTIRLPISLDL